MKTAGKSIYRCTETFQGDRCKLARHHAKENQGTPQPLHAGNFTVWDETGVKGKAVGAVILRKRNRSANRALRILTSGADMLQRKVVIAELGKLVEFFGGVR